MRESPALFFRSQHRATALFAAAVTGKFFFELGGVALINRESVVVIKFFARFDVA